MYIECLVIFTMLLLGRSRSGTSFRDVFSISVALSLGVVLQLSNITPGGSEARAVGHKGRKEKSDSEQKLANQNNSFPLCRYASGCP